MQKYPERPIGSELTAEIIGVSQYNPRVKVVMEAGEGGIMPIFDIDGEEIIDPYKAADNLQDMCGGRTVVMVKS